MVTVEDDLNVSRGLLGLAEDPAGSNHNFVTDWYAERIGNDGFRRAPWCAMARSYTFDTAGGDLTYAYCPYVEHDAKAGINGLVWLAGAAEVGAWVLFDFVGHGEATHVGHVEAVNSDGTIITLEGNIGDAYRRQHRDRKYVRGFVRPPFDTSGPVPDPGPGLPPATVGRTEMPDVRRGSRGRAVRIVQSITHADGGADGIFGANTVAAVRRFQGDHGLAVDGHVGPRTWTALLQASLNFIAGIRLDVDGDFGPATTGALIEFQRSAGLAIDGVAGYQTFGAISGQ